MLTCRAMPCLLFQVLSCVKQLLLTDPSPQVQQASLLVLNLLLKGLSSAAVSVLGDSLRDLYRLLKQVEGETQRDELTRAHARAALGQLDCVMREWAFPQQTLSKKITVVLCQHVYVRMRVSCAHVMRVRMRARKRRRNLLR